MNPSYNSPGSIRQPAIPSQGGDVVLSYGEKKSKKGLVIAVVALMLLVVGGLVAYMLLWSNNNEKDSGGVVVTTDVKVSFNAYVNYVLNGIESNSDLKLDVIEEKIPYFLELSSTERKSYIKKAGEKYDSFSTSYYKSGGSLETVPMKAYYQDYASLPRSSENDFLKEYLDKGKDATKEYIASIYSRSDVDNYFGVFLQDLKELNYYSLDLIANADFRGCIRDGAIVEGCYSLSEEESYKLNDLAFNVQRDESVLKGRALGVLRALYEEIYNMNSDTEGVPND